MPIVAVTGGVAAGKSTVTRVFQALGAVVIDADVLARLAVAPGSHALEQISRRFGPEVINDDGSLNRQALGQQVFSNETLLAELNAIVHPEVKKLYQEAVSNAGSDSSRVIVYDIPLLTEARSADEFDLVVVVHAPAEVRHQRLVEFRGLTEEQASQRIQSQAGDSERLALADIVLDSSGPEELTVENAQKLFSVIEASWPDRLSEVPALYQARTS